MFCPNYSGNAMRQSKKSAAEKKRKKVLYPDKSWDFRLCQNNTTPSNPQIDRRIVFCEFVENPCTG